jgi:KDO2-lipid IV(A) lauroyltransferase
MSGASSLVANIGMSLSHTGTRIVPLSLANAFAMPIGEAVGALWSDKREIAERNFAHILELPQDDPRVAATARDCFRHFGRYVVEIIHVQGWGTDTVLDRVDVVGAEHLKEAEALGKGTIFVSGHMGATEVTAAMAVLRGYRITTVVEQIKPQWLLDYMTRSRQQMGITILPAGRSGVSLLRTLRRGGMAAFVIDAGITRGGAVTVDFFGRPTLFPDGPARLARMSGAPLVFGAGVRLTGGRYRAYVYPPIIANRRANADADAREVTQELARTFEGLIRKYPSQWYAFREMWPERQPLAF